MKYFIDCSFTSSNVNRSGEVFNEWLKRWDNCLLADESALAGFLTEMKSVLAEVNAEFPRCKPLTARFTPISGPKLKHYISIFPEGKREDQTVTARITIQKCVSEFNGNEHVIKSKKGGRA